MAIVILERGKDRAVIDEAAEADLAGLLALGFEYPAKVKAAAEKALKEEAERQAAAAAAAEEEAKAKAAAAEAKKK